MKTLAWIRAMGAMYRRNIKILIRQPQLLIAPVVLPIVVMFFTAMVMGAGGDEWPIGLVNLSESPLANQVMAKISTVHSNITPYYKVMETDLAQAKQKVRTGRLQLLVIIPADFDQSRTLITETYNVNSDMMKNVRLRLEQALNDLMEGEGSITLVPRLVTEKPEDVWRAAFISGSCFLMALFFGACILAANLFSFDYENRTRKEIILTPVALTTAGWGIVLAAVTAAFWTSIPALLLGVTIFHMKIGWQSLLWVYLGMAPVMVGCAGLGLLVGHIAKFYRAVQPLLIVATMATFFGAGGFAGVAVLPPAAQRFAEVWVFSYIFEIFNPVLHHFKLAPQGMDLVFICLAGVFGFLVVPFVYRRESRAAMRVNGQ